MNEIYEKFLKLCQAKDNLTVSAGKICPNPSCPNCLAYYRLSDKHAHIWVHRDTSEELFVYKNSNSEMVNRFLEGSLNSAQELVLLSHEYGHYISSHCEITKRDTMEGCGAEFEIEREAWKSGERILCEIGFVDWACFDYWKKACLDGYYDGFKKLFFNFKPLKDYKR